MKIKPGKSVDQYINECPEELQSKLQEIRSLIMKVAPTAEERMDYFEMPGYSYEGYDYSGMFVWFSYKKPYIRLHVRPPVLQNHKNEVSEYLTTKSIISFPELEKIPVPLVKKLVKASIVEMKRRNLS
jgi:uncharacterized protein YdhG (YjbR/CyaY superfamily)